MQPKVSIVIPCYNKDKYISNMFDSILAQKWENIELILVNDGSTDSTRHIISEYEHEFSLRGFVTLVVDQENKGLPGAVYEGLKHVTGKYVCQVDADDVLDPEYVCTMAGWLEENPDYDWAVCDMLYVYEDNTEIYHSYLKPIFSEELLLSDFARSFILDKILNTVHEHMVRFDYLERSGLISNYFTETRRTQEPQWILPLSISGGKIKHISQALYRYTQNDDMMSNRKTPEDFYLYSKQYQTVLIDTIKSLRIPDSKKEELLTIAEIRRYEIEISYAAGSSSFSEATELCYGLLDVYNSSNANNGAVIYPINIEKVNPISLAEYITNRLIGYVPKTNEIESGGRLIAYAAYGKAALRVRAMLLDSNIRPDVFWDINAGDGDAIDNIPVLKPGFNSLCSDDTVMILLKSPEICSSVLKQLESMEICDNVWCFINVQDYLVRYYLEVQ